MKKEIINSAKIARSSASTTAHATKAGNLVFVTGQLGYKPGFDPRADRHSEIGSLEEQTVQVLENIKAILEEAGTNLENVVKRNVYLTHAGDFQAVFKIMERYFTSPVASTGVVTGLMRGGARVEIDVIAAIPG